MVPEPEWKKATAILKVDASKLSKDLSFIDPTMT
jgi:hypothetical protein